MGLAQGHRPRPRARPARPRRMRQPPLSTYAGPPPSRLARADSIRRAVKSAQRSRTCSTVANSALRISRGSRVIPSSEARVVLAAVEHQAHGVVPAAPGRQPVGQQERSGRDVQRELLLDLAPGGELRGLTDLDDAAGEVPVALVGEPADQHPAVAVADQQLADRALAGEERVEQRPEALRLADRRVADQPGVEHHARRVGPVGHAGLESPDDPHGAGPTGWRRAARRRCAGPPAPRRGVRRGAVKAWSTRMRAARVA